MYKSQGLFSRFARLASQYSGHPITFGIALGIVIGWACSGGLFGYSDTWQLVINTGTTIITFLMVFLIQNTQNRDSQAMHLKLDELIRSTEGAHTVLLDLEELCDSEIAAIRARYLKLAAKARSDLRQGAMDTGTPAVSQS